MLLIKSQSGFNQGAAHRVQRSKVSRIQSLGSTSQEPVRVVSRDANKQRTATVREFRDPGRSRTTSGLSRTRGPARVQLQDQGNREGPVAGPGEPRGSSWILHARCRRSPSVHWLFQAEWSESQGLVVSPGPWARTRQWTRSRGPDWEAPSQKKLVETSSFYKQNDILFKNRLFHS